MSIPTDPGINLQDNVNEPILLGGDTGLHERFTRLYDKFNGGVDQDNLSPGLLSSVLYGTTKPGAIHNIGFSLGGTGNGTLTIHQADGSAFADSDGNRGYIWLRSATSGQIIRGQVVSNVSIALVGAHWGTGTKGDLTSALLRVYAINDGNTADDFTVKFGIGYQGGFTYIRNTQDSTTATDINLPEEILVNSNITNDNSPMSEIGYIVANFDDTGNGNGEDFWTITEVYPGVSADGIWQEFNVDNSNVVTGFSSFTGSNCNAYFTMVGQTFFARAEIRGTSNATNFIVTMPIQNSTAEFSTEGITFRVADNSTAQASPGYWVLGSGSTSLLIFKAYGAASFTNVNAKGCRAIILYQAYQP